MAQGSRETQPDCNKELYKMTAAKTAVSPEQVEEFYAFTCEFIANKIKLGRMETIMLPNFGKFRPKIKQIQWLADRNAKPKL